MSNRYEWKRLWATFVVLALIGTGCRGADLQVEYELLFARVGVDTSGHVSVSFSNPKLVTPLGTFSAGVVLEPSAYFNKDHLLIVRLNGKEQFFGVPTENVKVTFESNYYDGVTIETDDGNVIVDVWMPGDVPVITPVVTYLGAGSADEITAGERMRVHTTEGDSLRLRAGPALDSSVIVSLPNGVIVTILEGPRKSDGYTWWKVKTPDNQTGWCVESADGIHTLLPSTSALSGQSGDRSCANSSIRFSIGDVVIVSAKGNALRILTDPTGGAQQALEQAVTRDRLKILDGPVCVYSARYEQNMLYWRVYSYTDGVTGWVADSISTEIWLCPLSNPQCDA